MQKCFKISHMQGQEHCSFTANCLQSHKTYFSNLLVEYIGKLDIASVAEPRHFYAAPGKRFDAAPAPAAPALAPQHWILHCFQNSCSIISHCVELPFFRLGCKLLVEVAAGCSSLSQNNLFVWKLFS
jgi:hypothetical protein